MEQKRTGLRVREQVISRIEEQVRRRLQELIGTAGYREILLTAAATADSWMNLRRAILFNGISLVEKAAIVRARARTTGQSPDYRDCAAL